MHHELAISLLANNITQTLRTAEAFEEEAENFSARKTIDPTVEEARKRELEAREVADRLRGQVRSLEASIAALASAN